MFRCILVFAGAAVLAINPAAAQMPNAGATVGSAPALNGGDRGLARNLPSKEQWDSSTAGQRWVAKAKQVAGTDPDLTFDFNVFCQASGGSNTTDRQSLGVPGSEPRLTPFPAPKRSISQPTIGAPVMSPSVT